MPGMTCSKSVQKNDDDMTKCYPMDQYTTTCYPATYPVTVSCTLENGKKLNGCCPSNDYLEGVIPGMTCEVVGDEGKASASAPAAAADGDYSCATDTYKEGLMNV